MLDNTGTGANALEIAVAAVAQRLRQLRADHRALTPAEFARYARRGLTCGWRLNVDVAGTVHALDLLVPIGFPWQPPRVALVNPPPLVTWPHLELDGLLCLAPNTLSVTPDDPAGVCLAMLAEACDLLRWLQKGEFDDDLRAEILSYWNFKSTHAKPTITSLLDAAPPTRMVRIWRGKPSYVLAEDDEKLTTWLTNVVGKLPPHIRTEDAALIWAGEPLLPREYPENGANLLRIARRAGPDAEELLQRLSAGAPDKLVTLLGFETTNGPALTATVLVKPAGQKHGPRDPLVVGFRPGKIPPGIVLTRYFGGGTLARGSVERADAAWIHGRGQDPRHAALRRATVIIIGCGSVGGPLAVALAQVGVGRLILVDFEDLSWSNTGRHPLGALGVGGNKAKGLAEKLRQDFPHIKVESFECDADDFVRKQSAVLQDSDLVVSATGSWSADARLDAWHAETERCTPAMYAWTEPHASAGHAVLIGRDSSLRNGIGDTGLPAFAVSDWPNGDRQRSEPACGAVYQPYGPIELGFVTNLAGELALDVLTGKQSASTHRIWVGSRRRLLDAGGVWSSAWRRDTQFREEGNVSLTRAWPTADRAAGRAAA